MLLNEFFGPAINAGKKHTPGKDEDQKMSDELFWFIVDHDRLHKDYFHPLASKIKKSIKNNESQGADRGKTVKDFMPLVKKGCLEFYAHAKMKGNISKMFPKELREELCERLHDHYYEDIIKDKYKLGA